MSINLPEQFVGGIKSNGVTSSLSGGGYPLKIVYFSFGSPVSASAVSKLIFEIKTTENNTKIYIPMLYGSGGNVVSFGSLAASASAKISFGRFATYSRTNISGGFKFG